MFMGVGGGGKQLTFGLLGDAQNWGCGVGRPLL